MLGQLLVWHSFKMTKQSKQSGTIAYISLKRKCGESPYLTAGEDKTAGVCWIRLVDKDKSGSGAVCERWWRACLGFADHSLGGLLADAVLTFVLEPLIKLTLQTTAGDLRHSQNQAAISVLNECGKKRIISPHVECPQGPGILQGHEQS